MKKHFVFDHDNLLFNENTKDFKKVFFKYSLLFLGSIATSVFYITIFTTFFDTPKEKQFIKERDELLTKYKVMLRQQEIISDYLHDIESRDNNKYRSVFEMNIIPEDVRLAGVGGSRKKLPSEYLEDFDDVKEVSAKIDNIRRRLYIQSKSFDDIEEMATQKDKMVASIPAIPPLLQKDYRRISDYFGYRKDPFTGGRRMHHGLDFSGTNGSPIYSTGNGYVESVTYSRRGYGNNVVVNHGFGYKTRYAHLSEISVKKGDTLLRGDVVGLLGNSGRSTGAHLHYEVVYHGKAKNPLNYMNSILDSELDQIVKNAEEIKKST